MRGYYSIGIVNAKKECNYGTLFRSAINMGAAYVFLIGQRFQKQCSDTTASWRHMPVLHFKDVDDFLQHRPYDCPLVAVELTNDARLLANYVHPERACYVLGPEDGNVPKPLLEAAQAVVRIPSVRCLNVAVAGSIVMYDRIAKTESLAAPSNGAGMER